VEAALARRQDFDVGPPALLRDDLQHLCRGFSLRDGHYLSARWPGDAHGFALALAQMLDGAETRPGKKEWQKNAPASGRGNRLHACEAEPAVCSGREKQTPPR
jgi:hypothetical protein